ncbi:MAG: VanZ family protein [bacterium]
MNLKFLKKYLPVILWMFVIFYLSHQPDLKSGLATPIDFVLRKIAHITEYAILCFLLIRATSNKKWSFLIAFIYACSDEFHQLFILGRHGSPRDVMIDSIGMILAVYFYDKFKQIFQKS